jgi:putative ABC transport system substrate-binding protein
MRRREFITLLGGATATWALAARAQQPPMPVIGFLVSGSQTSHGPWVTALVERLRELGWDGGRNVALEYRWAEGRTERFAEIAAEFVRLKVAVIIATGTAPTIAAKQATSVIPIVFPAAGDPVGTGLVTSLARPGGNVTGLSIQTTDIAAKRLELLRELVPGVRRLAIIAHGGAPASVLEMREVQAAAGTLGIDAGPSDVRRADDIATAFEGLKGRVDALYVVIDPLLTTHKVRINTLAINARLPTMYGFRELVEAGGLLSYGASFPHLWRRAADHVDKILRGAKPADLPVEQPTKFDLVVNLTTAKALGLTVPPSLLARADEGDAGEMRRSRRQERGGKLRSR